VTWPAPAAITFGSALSGTQLNATATYNGTVVAGAFTYSPSAGTMLGAGSHVLNVTFTPTDPTTYATTTATVTLVVNQAKPSLNWVTPNPITYGTALGGAQLNASASVAGAYLYSPAAGSILKPGTTTMSVTFTPTDRTDYTTASATVALSVNKAVLTVAATSVSKVYGAALPSLSYTVSGFVNEDTTASATTGTPALSTTATLASAARGYPITVAPGTLAAINYSFTLKPGTLTVTKAVLTVTAANKSVVYGSTIPALTYTVSGFVNGDTVATALTGTPNITTAALATSSAGTYPITLAAGSLAASNYSLKCVAGTLTISKAVLTVTANSLSKVYGATSPTFTYAVTGFINADTAATTVTGTPGFYTAATFDSPVGSYSITPSAGTLSAKNYSFRRHLRACTAFPRAWNVESQCLSAPW